MVNVKDIQLGTTTRKSFAKINEVMPMPNLIEVQKKSYQWFLDEGLQEVFHDIGPITDYTGNLILDFIDYSMDDAPKYTIAQCKSRDVTYAKPLKVRARLQNKETGEVKENVIYMGDFPIMTEAGTFVINGAERCIVSQLVRSPGVYYHMDHDKTGKELFTNTVIPNRGAWLEYETDANDLFHVRIDKNRKIYITTFLRALGLGTDAEIRDFFGDDARKFRFSHLASSIGFIPYGTLVDHFQHEVYEHPEMSPKERHAKWKELQGIYMPWIRLDGEIPFFSEGEAWQRQQHIYNHPFYYIDYCLAQTVALLFWAKILDDKDKAWEQYMAYTKQGGSTTFVNLLKNAGLKTPFDEEVLKEVSGKAKEWIESYDLTGIE